MECGEGFRKKKNFSIFSVKKLKNRMFCGILKEYIQQFTRVRAYKECERRELHDEQTDETGAFAGCGVAVFCDPSFAMLLV
jgi:hypothetical protein